MGYRKETFLNSPNFLEKRNKLVNLSSLYIIIYLPATWSGSALQPSPENVRNAEFQTPPDLVKQNPLFNKIPRWFMWTLNCEKHWCSCVYDIRTKEKNWTQRIIFLSFL